MMLESMRKLMAAPKAARSAPPATLPAPVAAVRRRAGACPEHGALASSRRGGVKGRGRSGEAPPPVEAPPLWKLRPLVGKLRPLAGKLRPLGEAPPR